MQHPGSVDMTAAAHLREQAQSLAKQYDLAASASLLPATGECIGQVAFLRKQAPDGPSVWTSPREVDTGVMRPWSMVAD